MPILFETIQVVWDSHLLRHIRKQIRSRPKFGNYELYYRRGIEEALWMPFLIASFQADQDRCLTFCRIFIPVPVNFERGFRWGFPTLLDLGNEFRPDLR